MVMPRIDSLMATRIAGRALMRGLAACAIATEVGLFPDLGALAAGELGAAQAVASAPMKMEEPIAGGMKRQGMKKGDMKKAAEKKDREMRDTIKKEERSMPQSSPK
jgi:hypothetical protein